MENVSCNIFSRLCDKILSEQKSIDEKYLGIIPVYETLRESFKLKAKPELFHSRVLSAFLKCRKDSYGVLKYFFRTVDNGGSAFSKLKILHPKIEAETGHIDLAIKDEDYIVIIENKVNNVDDLKSQLARYIEGAVNGAHYKEDNVYILYLTLDGRNEPKPESWARKENGKTSEINYKDTFVSRYRHVNFKNHIVPWLDEIKFKYFDGNILIQQFIEEYQSLIVRGNSHVRSFCSTWEKRYEEFSRKIDSLNKKALDQLGYKTILNDTSCSSFDALLNFERNMNCIQKYWNIVKRDIESELFKKYFDKWYSDLAHEYGSEKVYCDFQSDYPKVGLAFEWRTDKKVQKFYCVIEWDRLGGGLYYGLYKGEVIREDDSFIEKAKELIRAFYAKDRYNDRYQGFNDWKIGSWFYCHKDIRLHNYSPKEFEYAFDYCLKNMIKNLGQEQESGINSAAK